MRTNYSNVKILGKWLFPLFFFATLPAQAVVHVIETGNFYFSPQNLAGIVPGDTIRWVWLEGSHTTTSSVIPSGAASWDAALSAAEPSFEYVAVAAGVYSYVCTPHQSMGMTGSFEVLAMPDLALDYIAGIMVTFSGNQHHITSAIYVQNAGNAPSPSCHLKYYLSADSLLDGSDYLIFTQPMNVLAAGSSTSRIAFLHLPVGTPSGEYFLLIDLDANQVVTESNEDNNLIPYPVTLAGPPNTINGFVRYDNADSTGMPGCTVNLYALGNLLGTTTTGPDGSFTFTDVPDGTVTLTATTSLAAGGFNAIDGLQSLQHFAGMMDLAGLRWEAADADNSNHINSVDALMIIKRFSGQITTFPAGEWVLETRTLSVLLGNTYSATLRGICIGDCNGDYDPGS